MHSYIALGSRRGISSVIKPFGGLVQRGAFGLPSISLCFVNFGRDFGLQS